MQKSLFLFVAMIISFQTLANESVRIKARCSGSQCQHQHPHFFADAGPLPPDRVSYVLLPDGSHYVLDSNFFAATRELAQLLEDDHDHDLAQPEESFIPAPWQRCSDLVASRLEQAFTMAKRQHFWLKFSTSGLDLLRRYGPPAVFIIGAGELIEHGLTGFPFPLGCAGIYAAGTFSGKHMMRFWNMVRSEFPLEAPLGERLLLGIDQWRWNWRYWRAMRHIYDVSEADRKLLNETDSRLKTYFLMHEKMAFFELQLTLAKQSIAPLAETQAELYFRLSWNMTTIGKALDRYAAFVFGRAMRGLDSQEAAELYAFDKNLQNFFDQLKPFLETVEKGSVPLTSELGQAIWNGPRALMQDIRNLQRRGCDEWLKNGEDPRS